MQLYKLKSIAKTPIQAASTIYQKTTHSTATFVYSVYITLSYDIVYIYNITYKIC